MVRVYTINFEKPLRIIHVPTLLRDISLLWEERSRNTPLGREFVPLLTAVLAVAATVQVSWSSSPDDQSSLRYLKEDAPRYLDAWLKKLPRKQRTELWALQVETLLLLTRQLCAKETEELWKASGELVRSAMAMGLHINPRESTKISPFQAECRKRLWLTIVEMDLQMSIVSGMPLMIPELGFESLIPANLNDSDFDETTGPLSPAKGLDEETDTRFQIRLAVSLPQRIKTVYMAQHTNPRDSVEKRWKQAKIMQATLDENALWSGQFNGLGDMDSPKPALHPVITNGFLCRPLLALLQPLITDGLHDEHHLFPKIKQLVLELSFSILSSQDYFDPELDLFGPTKLMDSSWEIFQTLFHQDILSIALNVCQYIRLLDQSSTNQSPVDEESILITLPRRSLRKRDLRLQVESTLRTLTRRVTANGSNVKDILLLAVVLQSARRPGPIRQQDKLMAQEAKSALMSCRRHLISKQSGGTNPLSMAPNKPEVV